MNTGFRMFVTSREGAGRPHGKVSAVFDAVLVSGFLCSYNRDRYDYVWVYTWINLNILKLEYTWIKKRALYGTMISILWGTNYG